MSSCSLGIIRLQLVKQCIINVEPSKLAYTVSPSQDLEITIFLQSHTLTALPIPDYIFTRFTRNYHSLHYILPSSNSDSYKFSFFPSTIQAWNNLPISVIESDSMQLFIANLNQFYSCTCQIANQFIINACNCVYWAACGPWTNQYTVCPVI